MTGSLLERERREQARWTTRAPLAGLKTFERLLHGEFLTLEQRRHRETVALQRMIGHAVAHVPYYRALFRELGLRAASIGCVEDLRTLPLLTRDIVQSRAPEFRADRLPAGAAPGGSTKTSGTTGRPVAVEHTAFSKLMFGALKQREYRWWRVDPARRMAALRPPEDLPAAPDGELALRAAVERDAWPHVGALFRTGPFAGFRHDNTVEDCLAWLAAQRPQYLIAMAADLERLALAYRSQPVPEGLQALHSISQQLTPGMRALVEGAFRVPVHENYGLNEIGLVASRCPASGWFHVHAEHCLVEVVDERGDPVPAGRRGRLLVTALSNPAMPLIRYDTDDLVTAENEPCPCGRSLPSLRALHGRYRRTACLPPGTWGYWEAVGGLFGRIEPALVAGLRQFQLHQFRDGRFELRLASDRALPAELFQAIRASWEQAGGAAPAALAILPVREIPRTGPKHQDFTSDFMPAVDGAESAPAAAGAAARAAHNT